MRDTRFRLMLTRMGGCHLMVHVGFCREAAQDHSPGLQPWVSWLQSGALKVAPDVARLIESTLRAANRRLGRRFQGD